jgi:hypothetical protein
MGEGVAKKVGVQIFDSGFPTPAAKELPDAGGGYAPLATRSRTTPGRRGGGGHGRVGTGRSPCRSGCRTAGPARGRPCRPPAPRRTRSPHRPGACPRSPRVGRRYRGAAGSRRGRGEPRSPGRRRWPAAAAAAPRRRGRRRPGRCRGCGGRRRVAGRPSGRSRRCGRTCSRRAGGAGTRSGGLRWSCHTRQGDVAQLEEHLLCNSSAICAVLDAVFPDRVRP